MIAGTDGANTFVKIGSLSSHPVGFVTGNGERMHINTDGNVGIGVTPPSWYTGGSLKSLQVGSSTALFNLFGTRTVLSDNYYLQAGTGNDKYITTNEASKYEQESGVHKWSRAPSGSAGADITWTESMRIDASGRVGIGTSTVDSDLHVKYVSSNLNPLSEAYAGLNLEGSSSVRMLFGTYTASPYAGYIQASNTGSAFPLSLNPSGGNVGIGTSNPETKLHISGGDPSIRLQAGASADARIDFEDSGGTVRWYSGYDVDTGNLVIAADESGFSSSNIMLMNDSGNVLVGKTTTAQSTAGTVLYGNGQIYATAVGTQPLVLSRTSSDGPMAIFYKDSGEVGRIGANGTAGIFMSAPTSGGAAFVLNDNAPIIYPAKNNSGTVAVADNAIDLGASGVRWKNLYLSGGVYLGGTGSANYLDDYEEGIYTPTVEVYTVSGATFTYGTRAAVYTKVGDLVTVNISIGTLNRTDGGAAQVLLFTLPFAAVTGGTHAGGGNAAVSQVNFNAAAPFAMIFGTGHVAFLGNNHAGGSWSWETTSILGTNSEFRITIQYKTSV